MVPFGLIQFYYSIFFISSVYVIRIVFSSYVYPPKYLGGKSKHIYYEKTSTYYYSVFYINVYLWARENAPWHLRR